MEYFTYANTSIMCSTNKKKEKSQHWHRKNQGLQILLTITKCFCTYCRLGENFTFNSTCNKSLCHYSICFLCTLATFISISGNRYLNFFCGNTVTRTVDIRLPYISWVVFYPFIHWGHVRINHRSPSCLTSAVLTSPF